MRRQDPVGKHVVERDVSDDRATVRRRRLGRPVADHVNALAVERAYERITVLIPEVEPARLWQRALQNQRGAVIGRALRRRTDAVVCRLRLRM